MIDHLLQIENLAIGYDTPDGPPVSLVRDVSFSLEAGQTLGLVGESGCGKSTLLLSILGYYKSGLKRLSGNVKFEGQDPDTLALDELQILRGGSMALIPQNAGQALTPTLKISTQMFEALRLHSNTPSSDWYDKAIELFNRVKLPVPQEIMDRYPHELSGGQQQRVAVAMALAGEPRLLLLDEPTTGLDVTTQMHVLDLLNEIADELQTAMVYVSHDIGVISMVCENIAVMYAGEIVESGKKQNILATPAHPYTQALLASIPHLHQETLPNSIDGLLPQPGKRELISGCVFMDRCPLSEPECQTKKPAIIQLPDQQVKCLLVERSLSENSIGQLTPITRANPLDEAVLTVSDLEITYDRPSLLQRFGNWQPTMTTKNINFTIQRGQILGLVGESGSGKSTILRTVAGLQKGFSGSIQLLEQFDLMKSVDKREKECLQRIQLVFQNPDASLNPRRTIAEIIRRPLMLYFDMTEEEMDAEINRIMDSINLPQHYLGRYPGQLSGGEKQRVAIARALASKPDLILCDEITSALDVSVQASIIKLLLDLRDDHNLALLFVSHDLAVVEALSDQVIILEKGEICESGPVQEVFTNPKHPYTRSLMEAVL